MRRRTLLGTVTGGVASTLAGCLAPAGDPKAAGDRRNEPTARGPGAGMATAELPVPRSDIRQPLPRDYIPAITDPVFGSDWRGLDGDGAETALPGEAPVIGVTRGDAARAYPLRILNHHEIVNDEFDGPLAITYCVLCGSGIVFERRVEGRPTEFGVSGKLWRSDLVMYDRLTDSLWSQLLATAIRGPRTGEELPIVPSSLTTWAQWQELHPKTRILLPPPRSETLAGFDRDFEYHSPKYGSGSERQLVGQDSFDGGLHPKTLVVGVAAGGTARAYPFHVIDERGVVNDTVGTLPVVVATIPDGTIVAYDRRVDGTARRFEERGDAHLTAAGSRWERTTGMAVDGPHAGTQLKRANDRPPMFWTGWSNFYPESAVFGSE